MGLPADHDVAAIPAQKVKKPKEQEEQEHQEWLEETVVSIYSLGKEHKPEEIAEAIETCIQHSDGAYIISKGGKKDIILAALSEDVEVFLGGDLDKAGIFAVCATRQDQQTFLVNLLLHPCKHKNEAGLTRAFSYEEHDATDEVMDKLRESAAKIITTKKLCELPVRPGRGNKKDFPEPKLVR